MSEALRKALKQQETATAINTLVNNPITDAILGYFEGDTSRAGQSGGYDLGSAFGYSTLGPDDVSKMAAHAPALIGAILKSSKMIKTGDQLAEGAKVAKGIEEAGAVESKIGKAVSEIKPQPQGVRGVKVKDLYDKIDPDNKGFRDMNIANIKQAGLGDLLNERGNLELYHGTSVKNANAIKQSGELRGNTYFGKDVETANKFGHQVGGKVSVVKMEVDPADVLFDGNYFSSRKPKLVLNDDGVYRGVKLSTPSITGQGVRGVEGAIIEQPRTNGKGVDRYYATDKQGNYVHEFIDENGKSSFTAGKVKNGENFNVSEAGNIAGFPSIRTKSFKSFESAKKSIDTGKVNLDNSGTNKTLFNEIEAKLNQFHSTPSITEGKTPKGKK